MYTCVHKHTIAETARIEHTSTLEIIILKKNWAKKKIPMPVNADRFNSASVAARLRAYPYQKTNQVTKQTLYPKP